MNEYIVSYLPPNSNNVKRVSGIFADFPAMASSIVRHEFDVELILDVFTNKSYDFDIDEKLFYLDDTGRTFEETYPEVVQ